MYFLSRNFAYRNNVPKEKDTRGEKKERNERRNKKKKKTKGSKRKIFLRAEEVISDEPMRDNIQRLEDFCILGTFKSWVSVEIKWNVRLLFTRCLLPSTAMNLQIIKKMHFDENCTFIYIFDGKSGQMLTV